MDNASYNNVSLSNPFNKNKENQQVELQETPRVVTIGEYTNIERHCTLEEVDIRTDLNRSYPRIYGTYSPYISVALAVFSLLGIVAYIFLLFLIGTDVNLWTLFLGLPLLSPCLLYFGEAYTYWKACHKHLFGHYAQCEEGTFVCWY